MAHRLHQIATERYGLEPCDLIFDALTFPLSTGDDDLRRDAMNTIEAIRRIKAEIPGAYTVARRVERVVRPQPGRPSRPELACSCTSASRPASTPPSCTRHASCRSTRSPTTSATSASTSIYDRRRRPDGYDPLHGAARGVRRREDGTAVKEDRSGWPVEERLKQRIIDGDRDGLTADLDDALSAGWPAARPS